MLGRPERKEDLYITKNFNPAQIKCDEKYSLPEAKRLDKVFDEAVKAKQEHRKNHFKISYLNVRSLKASDGQRKDIAFDNIMMDTDLFGLAQCGQASNNHYSLVPISCYDAKIDDLDDYIESS